jgi:hypothetical protein
MKFSVRKMISISAEMAKQIEDYWFAHRCRTESEAFRQLLDEGLAAVLEREDSAGKKLDQKKAAQPTKRTSQR